MIELSIATSIAPSEWEAAGIRAIATAVELLEEQHERAKQQQRRR